MDSASLREENEAIREVKQHHRSDRVCGENSKIWAGMKAEIL